MSTYSFSSMARKLTPHAIGSWSMMHYRFEFAKQFDTS